MSGRVALIGLLGTRSAAEVFTASTVTYLKRMRLPLLAASIAMAFILLLDVFVFDPTARAKREEDQKEMTAEEERVEDKKEEKTLLFSQEAWDSIEESEDWDSIFDSAAWSSLLNEGFVGANVKDEPPLPRFKKLVGGGGNAVVPKDGALVAKAPAAKVPPEKAVISLGLGASAVDLLSGKGKKKVKKSRKSPLPVPETIEKFTVHPEEKKVFEWFDTSYKKSATYGKAKEFVEDEPLFKSCASSIVAARAWSQTILTLGPFKYLGRSKNPCWYPDKGGKFTCIPYFFLTGVSGPATDDVMQKILFHPDVIGKKEKQYWWDIGRHAGKPWEEYCQSFQEETDQILLDINQYKFSNKIFGDSTSTYFSSPTGWERLSGNENCNEPRITLASHIRRLRVKGLVMVVLPHPTRRLLAEFRELSKGKLSVNVFNDYLHQAINAYKNCFASYSLRQCAYNSTLANSVKLSLHEGMYSVYMEDWIRIFPPQQFLVVRFEDYVKNMVLTLETVYEFLNIPQIEPVELAIVADQTTKEFRELVKNHNTGSFLPESIRMLNDFYEPFLRRLGEIMNDPVKFTWRDT